MISQQSTRREQGISLGLHNSFMSLGRIIGPTWAGFVFDVNISLPYISGGIIMALALALTVAWVMRGGGNIRRTPESERATVVAAE